MPARATLMAIMLVLLTLPLLLDEPVIAQSEATPDPALCAAQSGSDLSTPPTPTPQLSGGLPHGMNLRLLATGTVEQLPRQDLVLVARWITLQPGAASTLKPTLGALLYFVVSGTAEIAIDGAAETYAAGSSAVVAPDQHYALLNPNPESAELLRVSIEPTGEETDVGVGGPPSVIDELQDVDAVAPDRIVVRGLLRGDIGRLPTGEVLLFLGCLSWDDVAADTGELRQPASVGLLILEGRLRFGESDEISAGHCLQFRPQTTHRLRAGEPAPVLLLFGAIPAGQQLWIAPDHAANSPSLPVARCGDET